MLSESSRSRYIDPALLVLLVVAIYGRVAGHEFLNWDDESYVVFNPAIRGLTVDNLRTVFSTYYLGNYAPVQMMSYMLDYALWGLRPTGFLMTNVVLHAANGLLWYHLVRRWCGDRLTALIAAALFLVHPVQVESVAWISQRKNLLAMFLFLLAWEAYCCYRSAAAGEGRPAYLLSFAAFGLALLTKSVVVIFPLVLICFEACFEQGSLLRRLKDKIPFILLTSACIVLSVFSQSQDVYGGRVGYHGGSAWFTFLTMLPVLCSYLGMLVWPVGLSALYSPLLQTTVSLTVVSAALLLALVAAASIILFKRDRRHAFWIMLFFIGLLPVMQIIPLNTLISDRYLYFPMLGVSALVGTFGAGCAGRSSRKGISVAVIAGIVLTLALLSFQRAGVWRDSLTLWTDAVQKVPVSSRAWGNLGAAYQRAGEFQAAFEAYQRGLELYPDNEQILYNLGTMYYDAGQFEAAEQLFQQVPPELKRIVPEKTVP